MIAIPSLVGDQSHHFRKLAGAINAAFQQACDDNEVLVASELLATYEIVLCRDIPGEERQDMVAGGLVACQKRLWDLKQKSGASAHERWRGNLKTVDQTPDATRFSGLGRPGGKNSAVSYRIVNIYDGVHIVGWAVHREPPEASKTFSTEADAVAWVAARRSVADLHSPERL